MNLRRRLTSGSSPASCRHRINPIAAVFPQTAEGTPASRSPEKPRFEPKKWRGEEVVEAEEGAGGFPNPEPGVEEWQRRDGACAEAGQEEKEEKKGHFG